MPPSDDQSLPSRLLDHVLLTATLAFAEEFHLDHRRRIHSAGHSDHAAMVEARKAVLAELAELETRTVRLSRSLTAAVAGEEAQALVHAYSVLDVRRIYTAMDRIHRHLLTLYPGVSEGLIEAVRGFVARLARASGGDDSGGSEPPLILLTDTPAVGRSILKEIG